ncbi:MAG: putative flap endonuclease-1-like 5' DNA nuclease [Verrucomicrobiales bacterium]|jgi:predicted flap endonuclease-1-like 5' DNA nuclease/predicted  nucleic acid-binding Zn-ribbon protein
MIWALWQILVPLLIALGVGVLIGWLLFRWRRRLVAAREWNQHTLRAQTARLELVSAQAAHSEAVNERSVSTSRFAALSTDYESTKVELDDSNRRISSLERDLSSAKGRISGYALLESEARQLRSDLETTSGSLDSEVDRADRLDTDLANADAEITALRADLAAGTGTIGQLEASAAAAAVTAATLHDTEAEIGELDAALRAARSELDHSQSRIADLDTHLVSARGDLDGARTRIGELKLDIVALQAPREAATMPEPLQPVASWPTDTWQSGATKLGTPGAKHADDLQVISGIGPKMEGLLNNFGITAWEQVAALRSSEVVELNTALDFFHGRIERDEWVDQAKELVEQFPDMKNRPTRASYLDRSNDDAPSAESNPHSGV